MRNVTVADLLDYFSGAPGNVPVVLDGAEFAGSRTSAYILDAVLDAIDEAKASDVDAL